MLEKSHDIVSEEDMGGGRDEYLTAVGGRNAATAGVAGATSCVHNNCPYGWLDTEFSGEMTPESPQAAPPYFDIQSIGNTISADGVGSPRCIEELYCRFEKEWNGWERIVLDLE